MSYIFHNVVQGSDEWNALRCGKVTASNFSIFMANSDKDFFGEPAKRYALQISLERINGCKSEASFTNGHMNRGVEQEPIARSIYEEEYFLSVDNGGFFDCGLYGDSPDGLVNNDGAIEIKSVIAPVHYANMKRGSFDPAYLWQIVGHLDCTGRDWVDFISYCSEFPRNKQIIVYRAWRYEYVEHINRLRLRRNDFLKLIDAIESELSEEDFYNQSPSESGGAVTQQGELV